MSDVGTTDRDLSTDTGLRNTIESSVATVAPGGPDVDSVVNSAREHQSREIKKRNDESTPTDRSDRLRKSIREAIASAKAKAAAPQQAKGNGFEVPPGPPVTWSKDAKARWESLPHEARMSALREQKMFGDLVGPVAAHVAEIERVMAPVRSLYRQAGIQTDGQAINHLLTWERNLRDPSTRQQAYAELGRSLGLDQQSYPQQQSYDYQPQQGSSSNEAEIAQVLNEFSKGRPHFEQVRVTMGQLMIGGLATDLQSAYDQALKLHGVAERDERKRAAAISPSGRSPSADLSPTHHGKGIRGAIKSAI